jgi:hypothetical protein
VIDRRRGALLFTVATLVVAGCGKPEAPAADAASERAAATERAKQRAYGGDAVKALEKSKGLEADLNRKVQDSVEKAEKEAK